MELAIDRFIENNQYNLTGIYELADRGFITVDQAIEAFKAVKTIRELYAKLGKDTILTHKSKPMERGQEFTRLYDAYKEALQ